MKDALRNALERLAVCPIAKADLGHPVTRPECVALEDALNELAAQRLATAHNFGQRKVWRIAARGIDALDLHTEPSPVGGEQVLLFPNDRTAVLA